MKYRYIYQLNLLLSTVLLFAGCKDIEPIEIMNAKIFFYSKNDTAAVAQPASIDRELTQSQIQLVQGWLKANRAGWSAHNPKATLLPQWCIDITSTSGKAHGLCRYQAKAVLRGLGVEMAKPLTEQDNLLFMKLVEDAS